MTLQTSSRTSGRRRNASQALLDAVETAPKDKETAAMRGLLKTYHSSLRPTIQMVQWSTAGEDVLVLKYVSFCLKK